MKKRVGLCLLCLFSIAPIASAQFTGGDGDGYSEAPLTTSFPVFLWRFAGGDGDGYDDAGVSINNAFAVNTTADPGTGACDVAECTLREAITGANANASTLFGGNRISFDIAGAGPHTIQPLSALPILTQAVTLDGTTEPDFAGTPVIELDGSLAGANVDGLHLLTAGGSTIRGLVINRFSRDGIRITGASGNTIAGNFLGTNASGTAALGNGSAGVNLNGSATNNTIGGTAPGAGNLVSGNNQQGFFIGFGAEGNTIEGNTIGADVTDGAPLGNGQNGILIIQASNNTIGGTAAGANNVIAYNIQDGVAIVDDASLGNTLRSNNIFANGQLGIDLTNDGVTANDAGDGDVGPNQLQNFPEVTQVRIAAGNLLVTYRLDALPANAAYSLVAEFFRADGDQQEGEVPLGLDTYSTTDHNGCGTPPCPKTVNLGKAAGLGFSAGDFLVATATDDDGNTSEFNAASMVGAGVTRYVSTTGSDTGNDCTNAGSPCATIAQAVAQAYPGDTLNLAAGTYAAPGVIDKALHIVGAGVLVQ